MAIETKRMWETGPLRQWANERPAGKSSWTRYENGNLVGFAGPYVCDDCLQPVVGVYRQKGGAKWICRGCYELVLSPKRKAKLQKT